MGRVIVVGSLNVDRPWRVRVHPAVGETVLGEQLAAVAGGKGLNQAVAAARFGGTVAMVGCVGADEDGAWLTGLAAAEGIEVSALQAIDGAPTGAALIVVADDGANNITVSPGANGQLSLTPQELLAAPVALAAGDVVVAQLEVPVPAVEAAFAAARSAGARSVFNPSPVGVGAALVPAADVVVVNQAEAAELSGAGAEASGADEALAQARAIAAGAAPGAGGGAGQTVVVTLGAAGAAAVGPEGEVVVDGEPAHALDTTGAGDCFLGVLATGMAEGRALEAALQRANRAAALQVTRRGAVDAMPRLADLAP